MNDKEFISFLGLDNLPEENIQKITPQLKRYFSEYLMANMIKDLSEQQVEYMLSELDNSRYTDNVIDLFYMLLGDQFQPRLKEYFIRFRAELYDNLANLDKS
ncbi:hypothetical protein JW710_05175 [Candidatus Dojkabacteria bacterium]|nr:hypothetical protein [Candidatus Dojkabacteria bacterium]